MGLFERFTKPKANEVEVKDTLGLNEKVGNVDEMDGAGLSAKLDPAVKVVPEDVTGAQAANEMTDEELAAKLDSSVEL